VSVPRTGWLRRLTALFQALFMLSLAACGTAPAKKSAEPSDFKVTLETPAEPTPRPEPPPGRTTRGEVGAAASPPVSSTSPLPAQAPGSERTDQPPPPPPPPPDRGPALRVQGPAGPRGGPGQPPVQPATQGPGRLVVFNFDNADLEIVLQATSELLVFNYVLAPEVRGKKVTVQTTGRIPVEDIFPVLLTILDVNGLAAVKSGSVYRIIAKQGAPQTPTPTIIGDQIDPVIPGDQVVTLITPLKFVPAQDAVNLLRPFVPQQAALTANRDTNLLVITDVAANVRRLLDIVKLVDVDVASSELQIIQLKRADAQEVAQILNQLFASGRFRAGTGAIPGVVAPAPPTPPPAAPRTPAPAGPGQDVSGSAADRAPLIVPERRSNSLIIYARKQEVETIRRLVDKLDADVYGGQRLFFYFCENTKARDLAATLDAIFGRGSGAPPTQTTPGPGQLTPSGTRPLGLPSQAQIQPTRPTTGVGGTGRLEGLLGDAGVPGAETRFIPDEATNSIIVTTYPRTWLEIEPIIKKLDRMPRQVLIEVLVAEVTLDDSMSLGLSWAVQSGRFRWLFSGRSPDQSGSSLLPGISPPVQDIITRGALIPPGLSFFAFAAQDFLAALNLLARDDKVRILSSPSVMTTENKKAIINVSKSVPVLTSQQSTIGGAVTTTPTTNTSIIGTQTVEYKDVGIVLTVTPRIGEEGTVALEVKQEVNDILTLTTGTLGSPTFSKREAETSVVLLNNQTLVLGGLIQTRRELIQQGIPFLGKLPVVGYAFRSTTENTNKTELLMLITPRVVGTALDAARLTDQMRRLTPELRESIRNKEFPYPSFEYMQP
jgi:general secretion pathway protein D